METWIEPGGPNTFNVYARPKGRKCFIGNIIHGVDKRFAVWGYQGWKCFDDPYKAIKELIKV